MAQINSYEEYDKEYAKKQKKIQDMETKVERSKLVEWSIKQVLSLSHRGIYRK